MHIKSVSVGKIQSHSRQGVDYQSAIDKYPTRQPVQADTLGLTGDHQADTKHHGGPHQAICAYPIEHYPFFATHAGHELAAPAFGENLTTYGLLERDTAIGDQYQIGESVIVEVSQPRQPCVKLNRKHNSKTLTTLIHETGFTGFYFRVIQQGPITAGDNIQRINSPNPDLTVYLAMQTLFGDSPTTQNLQAFINCTQLSPNWQEDMTKRLEQLTS